MSLQNGLDYCSWCGTGGGKHAERCPTTNQAQRKAVADRSDVIKQYETGAIAGQISAEDQAKRKEQQEKDHLQHRVRVLEARNEVLFALVCKYHQLLMQGG